MNGRARVGLAMVVTGAALLAVSAAAPAAAQDTWISAFGGLYMDPATVTDGESGTVWDFGTSFAAGAGVQHRFGQSLLAGVEFSYSPMKHEVRDVATDEIVLDEGRADVVTAMAVGRLGAGGGGGGGFSTYLAGGIGAMIYGIPQVDRWDPDLALRAGGGIEYGYSASTALFLEWNRWWVFHQSEGVDDNTVNHSLLQLGIRFGR